MTIGKTKRVITVDQDLPSLYFRRRLAKEAIKVLDQLTDKELSAMNFDDAHRKSAMENYKGQLANIDQKIAKFTGKPPAITVGLKTATLFGKADMK